MNQTELGVDSTTISFWWGCGDKIPYSFSCNALFTLTFNNLNTEIIVCIPLETRKSISTDLVLPFHFRNRRANIMRMKTFLRNLMFQTKNSTILNKDWSYCQRCNGSDG